MVERATDITGLFGPPAAGQAQPLNFRQGVILSFDAVTGENTVNVGGTILTDLPMLNSTEVLLMRPGAVVGLIIVGNTWAILGRLVVPNTPDAASALEAIATKSANVSSLESTTSTSYGDLATVGPVLTDVPVGASGRLLVILSAEIQASDPKGLSINTAGGNMAVDIAGATTRGPANADSLELFVKYDASPGTGASTIEVRASMSRVVMLDQLNPGLHTLTAKYVSAVSGNAVLFQNRNMSVLAL